MSWASAIGSIASSVIGYSSAKDVSAQNYANSKEAMQNKHQWEVEDLKKAGLNPLLSATNGTGTISGSGVSYSPDNPLENWTATKIAKKKAEAEVNSANAQTERTKFDLKRDYENYQNWKTQMDNNTAKSYQDYLNAKKQGALLDAQTNSVTANSAQALATAPLYRFGGEVAQMLIDRYGNRAIDKFSSVLDRFDNLNKGHSNKSGKYVFNYPHIGQGGDF